MTASVRTTCPYCGVGCGVLATPDGHGGAAIAGDLAHPANKGRLCSKGSALGETLGLDGRLLAPEVDGRRVSWGEALDEVAAGFKRIIAEHGPEAVAFYVSGQLLTEDYYAANKLLKGFIGSPHLDTNSRLCMASAVAGHKRGFGSDAVPANYEDIEIADLVVITGSNLAWCHPVLFQRLMQAKRERPGMRIVVIDPRRTATAEAADLHLPLKPGSDVMLYNGLLAWLADAQALDETYIAAHTEGLGGALAAARQSAPDIDTVAEGCGIDPEALEMFFQWFKAFPRTVTLFSMGVNQSSSGTDKVNAILNVHLATGRIGKPGAAPFSITGQPNAMGGREVGALANQLAAHMDYADPADIDRVRRFWRAPAIARKPGYKAVELIEAIERGAVKAVWVMATNPVVSLPDAARVRRALASLPLLVVSDCVADTDTLRLARIKLPALAWGEKDGTVTNSERRISRQRPFLPAPGHAKPDWQIVAGVARRLGNGEAFAWTSVADVFREHAALSAFENDAAGKRRRFDLGGLADLDDAAYAALAPVQWPVPRGTRAGTERLFTDGAFLGSEGRAQFVALTPRLPAASPGEAYPLALITGRVRDHWHTMTRTAKSPRLSLHRHEPFVEMHPADLAAVGAMAGQLVAIESTHGRMVGRAHANHGLRPGSVFAPMHWNEVYARQGRVNEAVNPAVDPLSGQPEFKHTPVSVRPVAVDWHGFLLSRFDVPLAGASWWAKARGEGYWRYELAGEGPPEEAWRHFRKTLSGLLPAAAFDNATVYIDAAMGDHRAAFLDDGRLMAGLFLGREPDRLPPRDWLGSLFVSSNLGPAERRALLAGRAPGQDDDGPLVCACFGVGRSAILRAIVDHDLATPTAVGAKLRAGTNCGSCLPEIALLVQAAAAVPKKIVREVA